MIIFHAVKDMLEKFVVFCAVQEVSQRGFVARRLERQHSLAVTLPAFIEHVTRPPRQFRLPTSRSMPSKDSSPASCLMNTHCFCRLPASGSLPPMTAEFRSSECPLERHSKSDNPPSGKAAVATLRNSAPMHGSTLRAETVHPTRRLRWVQSPSGCGSKDAPGRNGWTIRCVDALRLTRSLVSASAGSVGCHLRDERTMSPIAFATQMPFGSPPRSSSAQVCTRSHGSLIGTPGK